MTKKHIAIGLLYLTALLIGAIAYADNGNSDGSAACSVTNQP